MEVVRHVEGPWLDHECRPALHEELDLVDVVALVDEVDAAEVLEGDGDGPKREQDKPQTDEDAEPLLPPLLNDARLRFF